MRHPVEVARSLEARNQFPPMKSALVWLRYFIDAERFTRGHSRCFVDFDGLMRNPLSTVRGVFSALRVENPVADSELAPLLAAALKPSLRHHVAAPSDDAFTQVLTPSSPPMTAYAWGLEAAAGGNPSPDVLDRIHRNLLGVEKGRSIRYPSA
jgi:hypothetical protein